jgi:hypothetical protein
MGKMGDVIFSLPTIRAMGGGALYLPESTNDNCKGLFSAMRPLLIQQPCLIDVYEYPSGLNYHEKSPAYRIDHDLDDARYQPQRGLIHVVKRYLDQFNIDLPNWKSPWLTVEGDSIQQIPYSLINVTPRFRERSMVNWTEVLQSIKGEVFFVGTEDEHEVFCKHGEITMLFVDNILDLALLVRDAQRIYCNQSLVLALAQSLGKEYWLEAKPGKRNCLLETSNEHIL